LLGADAARLFEIRAHEAYPAFEVTDGNAARIAAICRRLDGLPFAIELAAARLRSMGLSELENHLDDRFQVLTGGSRTEVPHHQTLRGTVEWSYELLEPEERRLYRLLSVFRGGFGLDAVEFVYRSDRALDLVDALVAQSLVVADRADDTTRYRMLETIREHGHDMLAAADEVASARAAQLAYVADLVGEGARKLEGRDSAAWMLRFRTETDNIRAALGYAVAADPVAGAAMCAGLSRFWFAYATERDVTTLDDATSFLQEGKRWSEQMLEAAGPELPDKIRARLLLALGGLLDTRLGHYEDGITRLEEAEALWATIGNVRNQGWSVFYQGVASWGRIPIQETIGLLDRSVALHEEAEDAFGAGMSKHLRSLAFASAGDFDRAKPDLVASERLAQTTGNPFLLGHAEDGHALWAVAAGQASPEDRARIGDVIRHFRTLGNYACLGHGIHTAAMLLAQEGRLEEAARCLGIVTAIRDRLGMVVTPCEDRTAWVEKLGVGAMDVAIRTKAEDTGRTVELKAGIDWVLTAIEPIGGDVIA
jgi:non-specific serine/threonine protein kinase